MLAFVAALLTSRMAVIPLHHFTTESGVGITPPAFLTISVAASSSLLAAALVYFLEARHSGDPCVRRHRFGDMTEIVGFFVVYESVRTFFSASPWWMKLAVLMAGIGAVSFAKSLLRRRIGL